MFLVGAVIAVVSILATTVQHDYYRNIRDQKEQLERRLGVSTTAIATTRGMGGKRQRIARVTTLQILMLSAMAITDLTGLGAGILQVVRSEPAAKVQVVAQVVLGERPKPESIPMVLSQHGAIVATASPRPREMVALEITPGRYEVFALAGRVCKRTATITSVPLQRLVIRCP